MNKYYPFSAKQKEVTEWWLSSSPYYKCNFAICRETVNSIKRNIITPCLSVLETNDNFKITKDYNSNIITIQIDHVVNRFYLFGSKDESSALLIKDMKLGGVLFDNVTQIYRSFVEQALARCSLEHSKFWFNCNPEHPFHWFYTEWIQKKDAKNILYLHFKMEDNPSLSQKTIQSYKNLYSGAFYSRFIDGRWVTADGLVYPMFGTNNIQSAFNCNKYYVSCDYGTINPFTLGLWGHSSNGWFRIKEVYWSSRDEGKQLTDEEYYMKLKELIEDRCIEAIIIDPCAASFIQIIIRHGEYKVIKPNYDYLYGINCVAKALQNKEFFISPNCENAISEFYNYRWNSNSNRDTPIKENDHIMDDIRYFVTTIIYKEERWG